MFKIRKEERLPALVAFVVIVLFNGLLIANHFDRFTMGARGGFWTIFYNHLNMSGYDVFSLITLSCLRVHFSTVRHPLYIAILLPLYWLNKWLMDLTGTNCAVFLIAAVNTFCSVYSAVFLWRILRHSVRLSKADAALLTAMLFSFAHILIATMVPDHFVISMFMLMLTASIVAERLESKRPLSPLTAGILFLFTAGMTITNGVKTAIALLFTNGRKAFRWPYLAVAAAAIVVFFAAAEAQDRWILQPQSQKIQRIEEKLKEKNPNFGDKFKKHNDWVKRQNGEALTHDVPLLKWSDMTTPRLRSVTDNLFGEGFQLHRDHLLEDVQQTRPVFVAYRWIANYVVEALLVAIFAIGVWYGRRSRLLWMLLLWAAFDMVMHLGFGFGLNEVYIMTAHWAFVIPVAVGSALANAPRRMAIAVRTTAVVLTLWMWIYNGWIIADYLL